MSANLQSHLGHFVVSLVDPDNFLVLGRQPHRAGDRAHQGLIPGGAGMRGSHSVSQGLLGAQARVLCAAELQAAGKLKHRSTQEGKTQEITQSSCGRLTLLLWAWRTGEKTLAGLNNTPFI